MIPEGWMTYSLGDICEDIAYGYTESASSDEVGPKFLRITDIQDYFINWNEVPYCPISDTNHRKYKLDKGDIVIARTGASTGVTAIFKEEYIDAVYASYLIRYKINRKIANPFFVGYILKSQLWSNHVNSIIGGSAQPGANAKQFASFKLYLPPLEEQSHIASILSSLDDKIELNLQMNKTLEAIAQAIFKEWFVDFRFPGLDGELVDGLPKGWRSGILQEILTISKDTITPSKSSSTNFDHYSIPAFDEGKAPIKELGRTILSNKFRVKKYSILLSKLNPRFPRLWAIGDIDESNSISSTEFIVLQPRKSIYYSFLFYFLNLESTIGKMASLVTGTSSSHQRIRPLDINNLPIVLPDIEVVERYESIVRPIIIRITANINANRILSELRDSLLPQLMTGKIRIA